MKTKSEDHSVPKRRQNHTFMRQTIHSDSIRTTQELKISRITREFYYWFLNFDGNFKISD